MNSSANSNTYFYDIRATWTRFAAHVNGNRNGLVCVLSNTTLSDKAYEALEASMEKLGYGTNACTFLTIYEASSCSQNDSQYTNRARTSKGAPSLSSKDLFALVEGLDPLVLILADAQSAQLIDEAFRTNVTLQNYSRVAGRATVAFRSFQSMLAESNDRQKAWALLKRLAR